MMKHEEARHLEVSRRKEREGRSMKTLPREMLAIVALVSDVVVRTADDLQLASVESCFAH